MFLLLTCPQYLHIKFMHAFIDLTYLFMRAAGEGGWSFDECDERGNREVKHGIPEPPHRSLFSK